MPGFLFIYLKDELASVYSSGAEFYHDLKGYTTKPGKCLANL
ncbi:MAG TPA: hypothetical protein VIY08_01345 [Candidatus Nitrosocosmicus sp.]